jgi:tyrosinase
MHRRCRKNQATLSQPEKDRFVAAVLALKANGQYDQFVTDHMNFMAGAHRGPAFLPWHRQYLRKFELALQTIDASVTLPYWDWTVDNTATASLWSSTFLGGNGRPSDGKVLDGPFAFDAGNWTLIPNADDPFSFLRRRFGVGVSSLPLPTDVTNALSETVYDVAPYNRFVLSGFRNRVEGWISGPQLHNRVHVWVGGSMEPSSSPNDPVFFLNHCFVDKLWADWQLLHPGAGYLPVAGGPAGHNLNDAMEPWLSRGETVRPADVLNHLSLGYGYDTDPGGCGATLPALDITLKFIDDGGTLKFFDDGGTLKFRDDPITLKFRDDVQTLKFVDDVDTLKFSDDPITLKFSDDGGTVKFADDNQTSPRLDLLKLPEQDKPPLADQGKPLGSDTPDLRQAAPFVLSIPHHSMAWTQSFPQAQQAQTMLSQYEQALLDYQERIQQINQAFAEGQLSEDDLKRAEQLFQEYQALLTEYTRLSQQR